MVDDDGSAGQADVRRPAARSRAPRRRGGQQRRLPAAAATSTSACRCWASTRRRNVRRGRDRGGRADAGRVLRRRARPSRLRADGHARRRPARQQRDGPRPRPQRLRGRASRSCSADDGVAVVEIAVRRRPDRVASSSTRSTTSTSSTTRSSAVDALVRRHGLVVHDVERLPIHGGSLRLFIAAGSATGRRSRWQSCSKRSDGSAWPTTATTRGSPSGSTRCGVDARRCVREPPATRASRLAAYGAAAKGTVLLNHFGIDHSTDRLRGRPQRRTSRVCSCPGSASRSQPDGPAHVRAPGPRAAAGLELRRRDHRTAAGVSRRRRCVRRAAPRAVGGVARDRRRDQSCRSSAIPDERGTVHHMLRRTDPHFIEFGEIYFTTVYRDVVKGWHRHREMTLNYACIWGRIKLVLFDDRDGSTTRGELVERFLGPDDYSLVIIPPGVWNGFKGMADDLDGGELLHPPARPDPLRSTRPVRRTTSPTTGPCTTSEHRWTRPRHGRSRLHRIARWLRTSPDVGVEIVRIDHPWSSADELTAARRERRGLDLHPPGLVRAASRLPDRRPGQPAAA